MRGAARYICLVSAVLMTLPAAAWAAPRVRCQVKHIGKIHNLEFKPGSDPYVVEAIDIDQRFRFKVVVIGDEQKIDYLKTYVYYQTARQPVLLHSAHFFTPIAQPAPSSLTGVNHIYSPDLGRELQYDCAVFEVTE